MSTVNSETKPAPPAKPIKLRSACNSCFSAKVRCDGNKQGCRRCIDKHFDCHYSESRVGKVVGKRRKRPLPGTVVPVLPDSWSIGLQEITVPSPPLSDSSSQRFGSLPHWNPLMSYDNPNMFDFGESQDPYDQFMPSRSYSSGSDAPMFTSSGLPTPGMSPADICFVPPTFESRSPSNPSLTTCDTSRIFDLRFASPMRRSLEPVNDDDETVCIKLLAHLKKNSSSDRQGYDAQLSQIQKTNAAVRRLLKSGKTRSDYTCQLLLSSIAIHLVTMCENLTSHSRACETDFLQEQFSLDGASEYYETPSQEPPHMQHDLHDSVKAVTHEAAVLSSSIGDMLKRRPTDSYQTLGRHEALHMELDHRLKKALRIIQ